MLKFKNIISLFLILIFFLGCQTIKEKTPKSIILKFEHGVAYPGIDFGVLFSAQYMISEPCSKASK